MAALKHVSIMKAMTIVKSNTCGLSFILNRRHIRAFGLRLESIVRHRHLDVMIGTRDRNTSSHHTKTVTVTETEIETEQGNSEVSSVSSWNKLPLHQSLIDKLISRGMHVPAPIQSATIANIIDGQHVMIQSETGSGKTLSYLLPVLDRYVSQLSIGNGVEPFSSLIIVPTRELAFQVWEQVNELVGEEYGLAAMVCGGPDTVESQIELLSKRPAAMIIGTPKRLYEMIDRPNSLIDLSKVEQCVIDEADRIFKPLSKNANEKEKLKNIRHPKKGMLISERLLEENPFVQMVWASATINERLRSLSRHMRVKFSLPFMNHVRLGKESRLPVKIAHEYIICEEEHKMNVLDMAFRTSRCRSALVFVHSHAQIHSMVNMARARGFRCSALHESLFVDESDRMSSKNGESELQHPQRLRDRKLFMDYFRNGTYQMVVVTEDCARGLDFPWLTNVFIMSPPRTANEYLHLAGRTGRMGRHGRVLTLLSPDQAMQVRTWSSLLNVSFRRVKITKNSKADWETADDAPENDTFKVKSFEEEVESHKADKFEQIVKFGDQVSSSNKFGETRTIFDSKAFVMDNIDRSFPKTDVKTDKRYTASKRHIPWAGGQKDHLHSAHPQRNFSNKKKII